MVTGYRVIPELDKFKHVIPDDAESAMKFPYDGAEIGKAWSPPSTYQANPKKPSPDSLGLHVFWCGIRSNSERSTKSYHISRPILRDFAL